MIEAALKTGEGFVQHLPLLGNKFSPQKSTQNNYSKTIHEDTIMIPSETIDFEILFNFTIV